MVFIPQVKLKKYPKQSSWVVKVWVIEELFYYKYPFCFPNFFKQNLTKDEFEIRFKFIQVFSCVNIEKEFFIQLVEIIQEFDFIEAKYKIFSDESCYYTNKLALKNISEGFVIYEKLSI